MTLSTEEEARIVARERLRILAWGYYIYGGFTALMMSFFLVPVLFMVMAMSAIPASQWNKPTPTPSPSAYSFASPAPQPTPASEPPPKFFFAVFAAFFSAIVLGNLTVSALTICAGHCIQRRKHKMFLYVVAIINCLFIPYGTLLGVFTILLLGMPEAAAEFKPPTT
jgi:hypothetical protein